jgi:hypothetical protein
MSRFQLYQRLRAQATKLFGSHGTPRVRVIRTEVIVEQEKRLWLIRQGPAQGSTPPIRTGGAASPVGFPLAESHPALPPGEMTAEIPGEE